VMSSLADISRLSQSVLVEQWEEVLHDLLVSFHVIGVRDGIVMYMRMVSLCFCQTLYLKNYCFIDCLMEVFPYNSGTR